MFDLFFWKYAHLLINKKYIIVYQKYFSFYRSLFQSLFLIHIWRLRLDSIIVVIIFIYIYMRWYQKYFWLLFYLCFLYTITLKFISCTHLKNSYDSTILLILSHILGSIKGIFIFSYLITPKIILCSYLKLSMIPLYHYYYFTPYEFSPSANAGSLSLEFDSASLLRSPELFLSIFADLNNSVVWIVSILSLIYNYYIKIIHQYLFFQKL